MQHDRNRWWENYLVRYFVPSICGMIIIFWLHQKAGLNLPEFILPSNENFNSTHLITWFLLGTLYCYLASYPILVFHATRVLDFEDGKGKILLPNPYFITSVVIISSLLAIWLNKVCYAVIPLLFFLGYQLFRLYCVYSLKKTKGFSRAYAYLYKLSQRRSIQEEPEDIDGEAEDKITPSLVQDMVDSYRHLREHGNTAFIILLEITLAPFFVLTIKLKENYPEFNLADFFFLSLMLSIWIFPAALTHLLAQHLERSFSRFNG